MMGPSAIARPTHSQAVTVMGLTALFDSALRTSAAAAAAALGSFAPPLPPEPPTVRPGPVTFGFALAGIEALVAGAGAAVKVRPGPWKLSSLDDLPQILPIVEEKGVEWANGRRAEVTGARAGRGVLCLAASLRAAATEAESYRHPGPSMAVDSRPSTSPRTCRQERMPCGLHLEDEHSSVVARDGAAN